VAVLQGSFAVAINQMFWAPRLYERIYHRMQNLMIMSTAQSAEPTVPYTRDSTNKRSQHVYGPIVTKYYNSYLPHAAIPTISTPLSIHLPLTTDRYASAYRLIFAFS